MGRYLVTAVLVRLADSGARVALTLLALQRTNSAVFGGLLVAAVMIPHVLAAPLMGALADRVRHRRAFHSGGLIVYGLSIVACGPLTGRAPAAVVLTVAAAGGCFAPLAFGGLSGSVRELSSKVALPRRYGLDSASYNVAGISGPALAGVAAALVGPSTATVLVGLSAAVGGAGVLTFRLPARSAAAPGPLALRRGLTAIWRSPSLLAVTTATSLSTFGLGGSALIAALIASERHSPAATGGLLSALAVGALIGSLVYARWPVPEEYAERLVFASLAFTGVALGLAAFVPWLSWVFVLFAIGGFANGPQGSAVFTIRDREAPVNAHTQVFTVGAGLKVTAAAIGAAVTGVAAGLGAPVLLVGAALAQLLGAAVGAAISHTRAPGSGLPPLVGDNRITDVIR